MARYDTFISYSHADLSRADRVKKHLDRAGLAVWMDRERISLGDRFRDSISQALQQSRSITPILTEDALDSDEVFREVQFGISAGMKIVPVVLSPTHFVSSNRWPSILDGIDWGRLDRTAVSRNLTEEVLSDIVRALRRSDDRRCPVLCVYHFKGGVGKTTVCAHLGAQLYQSASPPISVLMIDCDAQSNLSSVFLTRASLDQANRKSHNLIGLLEPNRLRAEPDHFGEYDFAPGIVDDRIVQQVQSALHFNESTETAFAIIPNSIAATKYGSVEHRRPAYLFQNFQNAIQKLSYHYDLILLDCNPSATLLSECALHAATDIIVPLRTDKYTADGLENIDALLRGNYRLEYSYGEGRYGKQLWSLINFADLSQLGLSNQQRSSGNGSEAEILRKFYAPLRGAGGQDLSRFLPSLLKTRIPDSGFLRSKPVATAPLDPDRPPSRSLLNFFGNRNAASVEDAINKLAAEIRAKTKSASLVVTV